MAAVKRQSTAEEDLFEIWSYIAEDSIPEANELIREIDEELQLLGDNPKMGSRRDELGEHHRSFPVKNYVIYYRPLGCLYPEALCLQNGPEILRRYLQLVSYIANHEYTTE